MPTLLLRLCGPMQAWGTRSRFSERDTELEPSKSGVIGLLAAALGLPRSVPVDGADWPLARLVMGVRVDREGRMARDYHTAGGGKPGDPFLGIATADGGRSKNAVLSNRYYLADADFLVGLEYPEPGLLHRLEEALQRPRWQIFLGRKSFVPSVPVHLPNGGLRDLPLVEALLQEPWPLAPNPKRAAPGGAPRSPGQRRFRFVLERPLGATNEVRMDQPLGAAFQERSFGPRYVETLMLELPQRSP